MAEYESDWAIQGNKSSGWENNQDDFSTSLLPPPYHVDLYSDVLGDVEPLSTENGLPPKEAIQDLGIEYFLQTYPVFFSKHYKSPPKNFDDVRNRIIQGGVGSAKALSKEEKAWCNLYFQLYGNSSYSKEKSKYDKKGEILHPVRKRIVDKALSMVGTIIAEQPSGEKRKVSYRNISTNVGADKLVEIFEEIAPHKLTGKSKTDHESAEKNNDDRETRFHKELKKSYIMDSNTMTGGDNSRDSWCGILAFWIQHKAGNGKTMWEPTIKHSDDQNGFMDKNEEPMPGDMCYNKDDKNHYGTVIAVEGDTIISVDGNSKPSSGIWLQKRSRSYWKAYIRARPKNEDLSTGMQL